MLADCRASCTAFVCIAHCILPGLCFLLALADLCVPVFLKFEGFSCCCRRYMMHRQLCVLRWQWALPV